MQNLKGTKAKINKYHWSLNKYTALSHVINQDLIKGLIYQLFLKVDKPRIDQNTLSHGIMTQIQPYLTP